MRVGKAREENEEEEENWEDGFVGTKYEDLGDGKAERRRKFVGGDFCSDVCLGADEEKREKVVDPGLEDARDSSPMLEAWKEGPTPTSAQDANTGDGDATLTSNDHIQQFTRSVPCLEIEGRPGTSRIDAVLDGNVSPGSSNRTRVTKCPIGADMDKVAAAEETTVDENDHTQSAQEAPSRIETQMVGSSPKKAPSVKKEMKEVPQIAFMPEGDDTEYLHAFLTRAKAKKAARSLLSPERQSGSENKTSSNFSPHTRSRTALSSLDRNSPSPKKNRKIGAPARKLEPEGTVLSDMNETSPLRKSSRTRLPRPQRHQQATPGSIPFRRSNGTEFVFLQKSEAQQIAIATRSNTRRNKGEAVQPALKLEVLSTSQIQNSPAKVARTTKTNKQVAWDEGLAYFAPEEVQCLEGAEEQIEPKTPVKRSRRLAPGKGTPAPKKSMAEAAMDVGTPITRTRTRTKGKP